MAERTASLEAKGMEAKLLDQVVDAIGGQGSLIVVSGGSIEDRHALITQVGAEAEGMGCLVAISDCSRSSSSEPIAESLMALDVTMGGKVTATTMSGAPRSDRSYAEEMAMLEILRSACSDNPVIVAIEEIGESSLSSIDMLCFLARNIGGISSAIIVTHRSLELDPLLVRRLEMLGHEMSVHKHHIHTRGGKETNDGLPIEHRPIHQAGLQSITDPVSPVLVQIAEQIRSAEEALASGDPIASITRSEIAWQNSVSVGHYGFKLDSQIAMGAAMTQAGWEKEALRTLGQAVDLAGTLGELRSQYMVHIKRSELLLFGLGEPDSAGAEAGIAEEISTHSLEEPLRIEPLSLRAIIEAVIGRQERAEAAFCEATTLLEKQPIEALVLERTLLALAAAMFLEARHDLNGMNQRYAEAEILAGGTTYSVYWEAVVSLQRGRSLLRLKRPQEAKGHMDRAADRFDRLGNTIQSARARKAVEVSEERIMLD